MLRRTSIAAVLLVLLGSGTGAFGKDHVAPDQIARWIRHPSDGALEKAVRATRNLSDAGRRAVFQAVRRQVRVDTTLRATHLASVKFVDAPFSDVIARLNRETGLDFLVSPRGKKASTSKRVTIAANEISAFQVLELALKPYRLTWRVRGDGVWIGALDEIPVTAPAGEPPPSNEPAERPLTREEDLEQSAFEARLEATRLTMRVRNRRFADVLEYLTGYKAIDFKISPSLRSRIEDRQVTLTFEDAKIYDALDVIAAKVGVKWKIRAGYIVLSEDKDAR